VEVLEILRQFMKSQGGGGNGGRGSAKGNIDESVNASSTSAPTSLLFQDSNNKDINMDAASPKFKFLKIRQKCSLQSHHPRRRRSWTQKLPLPLSSRQLKPRTPQEMGQEQEPQEQEQEYQLEQERVCFLRHSPHSAPKCTFMVPIGPLVPP
jgi:hypothetical protein